MDKTALLKLIGKDEIDQALNLLESEAQKTQNEVLLADVTMLAANYSSLVKQQNQNLISRAEYSMEIAKFRKSLIDLINQLESRKESNTALKGKTTNEPVKFKNRNVFLLIGLLLLGAFLVNEFFGFPIINRQTTPSSIIEKNKPGSSKAGELPLEVEIKTNKGKENLEFVEGETMRLFFKVNQPCYLRILYRLATDEIVLFYDDKYVEEAETNKFIEIGDGFEAAAPFGKENLHVFLSRNSFPKLNTQSEDGYTYVMDQLPEALSKTRGFKKKNEFVETSLEIVTKPPN